MSPCLTGCRPRQGCAHAHHLAPQVHDEVILEGPKETADLAQQLVVDCMMHPFDGTNPLDVELVVDAKHADTWFAAK